MSSDFFRYLQLTVWVTNPITNVATLSCPSLNEKCINPRRIGVIHNRQMQQLSTTDDRFYTTSSAWCKQKWKFVSVINALHNAAWIPWSLPNAHQWQSITVLIPMPINTAKWPWFLWINAMILISIDRHWGMIKGVLIALEKHIIMKLSIQVLTSMVHGHHKITLNYPVENYPH